MDVATKRRRKQILVWLVWAVACLVFLALPPQAGLNHGAVPDLPALPGIITYDPNNGPLFPWQPRYRWRTWALNRYKALRRAHRLAETEQVWESLTAREREVLALVAQGKDNAQIGQRLCLAEQTVKNYVHRLYVKLGVKSRAEAVVWAAWLGIAPLGRDRRK